MTLDEYLKINNPLSRSRFKLFPYHVELWKLKSLGFSLGQIKEFLQKNQIETNISMLSYYFKNNSENNKPTNSQSETTKITKPAISSTPPTSAINSTAIQTAPPNISRKVNSPEELRKLMYAPVDIKAILKAAQDIKDAEKSAKLLNK